MRPKTSTKKNKKLLYSTFLFIFLSGCGGEKLTDLEYIQQAKAHIIENNSNSAILELKNALQVNASNPEARFLLGNIYIALGDAESGTKELIRANGLGIPHADTAISLANALHILNKNEEIISRFNEIDGYPKEIQAELNLIKGRALHNSGKEQEANSLLLSISKLFPNSVPEIKSKAFISYYAKDYKESEKLINEALAKSPDSTDALFLKGDILFAQKKYKAASDIFSKLTQLQPYYVLPQILLGISQLKEEKLNTAITTFKEVISKTPSNPLVNYFIATAYLKQNKYEEAKIHAEKAIDLDSSDLRSRLIAGFSNYMTKNYEQSVGHLKKFISIIPDHQTALKILAANQTRLGFNDQAIATLNKVTTLTENDATLLASIANEATNSGDLRTGKAFFEKAVALNAKNTIMLANLGLTKVSSGDVDEGLKEMEKALDFSDSSDNIQFALILTYLKTQNFDKAIQATTQLQQTHPKNPDGFTLQGIAYAGKNELEKAKKQFEKALEIHPSNANASNNLASYYRSIDNNAKAEIILINSLKKNEGNPKLSLALFKVYSANGDFNKGTQVLEESRKKYPNNAETSIALASNYLFDNLSRKVLGVLNPIKEEGKYYPSYLEIKGRAELIEKQYNDAISSFNLLIKIKPKEPAFHYYLATAHREMKDFKAAKASFKKASNLNPRHELYRLAYIKTLFNLGENENAKKQIKKLNKKSQKIAEVLVVLGNIALSERKPDEASHFFQQALTQKETNIINILYAKSLFAAGKSNDAFAALGKWLEKYPKDIITHQVAGDLYLEKKKYDLALNSFQQIIALSPQNIKALNNTAWLLHKAGKLEDAEAIAQQANSLNQNNPVIQDTYGMILLDLGKTKKAVKLMEKSSASMPNNIETQYNLALAYFKNKNREKSKEVLSSILLSKTESEYKKDAQLLLDKINK